MSFPIIDQKISPLAYANDVQYKTTSNLNVRQAFNTLPKEDSKDTFAKLSEYYKESGFLNMPGDSLEVGGGNGIFWKIAGQDFCQEVKEKGKLFITDDSEGMIDACKKVELLNDPEITLEVADITSLKYENASFARVSGHFMMYECGNVEKGVSEIARVLQPNGRAILVTMDEKIHMIQLYSTLQEAKDLLKKTGIAIKTDFPQYAPSIIPFCAGNALDFLEKSFESIKMTKMDNALLVKDKMPEPNDTVSGPDFVVKYLQSLTFIQAAMKANELPDTFFQAIQNIVAEEIQTHGVFRITRCDIIYDCSNPKTNTKTLENTILKV